MPSTGRHNYKIFRWHRSTVRYMFCKQKLKYPDSFKIFRMHCLQRFWKCIQISVIVIAGLTLSNSRILFLLLVDCYKTGILYYASLKERYTIPRALFHFLNAYVLYFPWPGIVSILFMSLYSFNIFHVYAFSTTMWSRVTVWYAVLYVGDYERGDAARVAVPE